MAKVHAVMHGSLAAQLRALHDGAQKALRPAAHAGALVFYREMRLRVPVDSGRLYGSIYRVHVDSKSSEQHQVYQVGPNVSKAPHWHNVEFGHWRYNAYGDGRWLRSKSRKNARVATPGVMDRTVHDLPGALQAPEWVMPSPYIRPTFDSSARAAVEAMKARYSSALRETETGWQ